MESLGGFTPSKVVLEKDVVVVVEMFVIKETKNTKTNHCVKHMLVAYFSYSGPLFDMISPLLKRVHDASAECLHVHFLMQNGCPYTNYQYVFAPPYHPPSNSTIHDPRAIFSKGVQIR